MQQLDQSNGTDKRERSLLRLLRIDDWFTGIGVAAFIVGATAALVLQAGDPAHTVAAVIVGLCSVVFVVAVVGVVVTGSREDRAIARLTPLADISDLMDKHLWDEAIGKLEIALTSPHKDTQVQAWNLLAQCYAATGRNADSEAMIRRSIEEGADQDKASLGQQLACLGVVVRRQGRNEEAEQHMGRALDLLRTRDPEATVFVLRNIAYLYWINGQQDRALEIYENLPEHDPDQLAFLEQILEPFAEPPLPTKG